MNPLAPAPRRRPERLAGLPAAGPAHERRSRAPPPPRRGDRGDVQPHDLRAGHRRVHRLRRGHRPARRPRGPRPPRGVLRARRSTTSAWPPTSSARCTPTRPASDGYVSFELEPALAHDTAGSVAAAHDLVARIGKPNVMIKVPGTPAGVAAVEELTADGRQRQHHPAVLRRRVRAGGARLRRRARATTRRRASPSTRWRRSRRSSSRGSTPRSTRCCPRDRRSCGRTAIANAKLAYQRFREVFAGEPLGPARGRRVRGSSGRCGPRPGPRTPPTPTRTTSRRWSGATR